MNSRAQIQGQKVKIILIIVDTVDRSINYILNSIETENETHTEATVRRPSSQALGSAPTPPQPLSSHWRDYASSNTQRSRLRVCPLILEGCSWRDSVDLSVPALSCQVHRREICRRLVLSPEPHLCVHVYTVASIGSSINRQE